MFNSSEMSDDENSNEWLSNFEIAEDRKSAICVICRRKLSIHKNSNLKRHLILKHSKVAQESNCTIKRRAEESATEEPLSKKLKISSEADFIRSCVDMLVVPMVPFSLFDFPGFCKIMNDHEKKFNIRMNSKNARNCLNKTALAIKKYIEEDVKGNLISIKADIGTRMSRSFLGINIQYFSRKSNKVVIRTIGNIK